MPTTSRSSPSRSSSTPPPRWAGPAMVAPMPRAEATRKRCAIYTRKSSEEGLEQEFNSLHAQREASEAYIRSQRHEGWVVIPTAYDDGGFSGGTMERPISIAKPIVVL